MSDPLAVFFTIPVTVFRKIGDTASGAAYAAADASLKGRVRNERKLVVTADGKEVVSESGVSFPLGTPLIPLDSKVTLPDGRTAFVLVEGLHDSGLSFMPNYYSIDLT
ncbi:hypothetical protein [Antrihabitans spumae]|uniref:Uncharacterized protein n=1 Tax=Antrihabitans spumae TaxID=3373370 RepID=A0ABW7KDB7_9NOCA